MMEPEILELLEMIERWKNGEDNEFDTVAMNLLKKHREGIK